MDEKVTKVELKDDVVSVELINGTGDVETLDSTKYPTEDFYHAFSALVPVFMKHADFPMTMKNRISIRGVREKHTKDSSGYVIMALIKCNGMNSEMNVRTGLLAKVDDSYWEMKGRNGKPVNNPELQLSKLTAEERKACQLVLDEALLFAKKGKVSKGLDLFGEEEE